jgi:ATP-binding cassette subfamily B (MDR/TAP) protein 1
MWVHRYIGIVQQEPTLFATTIKRNITYAVDTINQSIRKQHKKMSEEELNKLLIPVNDELVEKAAKAANCHDFISGLPDK